MYLSNSNKREFHLMVDFVILSRPCTQETPSFRVVCVVQANRCLGLVYSHDLVFFIKSAIAVVIIRKESLVSSGVKEPYFNLKEI